MIVLLTNSEDVTADFLADKLRGERVDVWRLNTDSLADEPLSMRLDRRQNPASDLQLVSRFVIDVNAARPS